MFDSLPGTPRQQAILQTVLQAYAADADILTIGVFGSVVRSPYELADIDLDVTVAEPALLQAPNRVQALIDYLNTNSWPIVLAAWDGPHAAELILETLDRIDLTIHPPETSKAEVLRDLVLLRGERQQLPVSGKPALTPEAMEARLKRLHEKLPVLAVGAAVKLRQRRLWDVLNLLHEMRAGLMDIYGLARGSTLPARYFARHARAELQQALGETLATYDTASAARAFRQIVTLYRDEYVRLSAGRLALTEAQTRTLDRALRLLD